MKRYFAVMAAVMLVAVTASGAWADVAITEANFPDESFRKYVSKRIDTNQDGVLTEEEISAVKKIDVGPTSLGVIVYRIQSLKGLEHFTGLEELYCGKNKLISLDVSKNTALRVLKCEECQLTTLNVTGNPNLTSLTCDNNSLTGLDVTGNPNLGSLKCNNNSLTELDLSNNASLGSLECYSNQLTVLDLSNKPSMSYLDCANNQLSVLDLRNNPKMTWLECSSNQLTSLTLNEDRSHLDLLNCIGNQLTELDVSNMGQDALGYPSLNCSNNKLVSLNVSNSRLWWLTCDHNELKELNIGSNSYLAKLNCTDNKLIALDISGCPNLSSFSHDDTLIVIKDPPEFKTQSFLLSGQIGLNFYMNLPAISGVNYSDSSCYMAFDVNGDSASNNPQPYDPEFMNAKKTYYGFRCYINSIQMADPVTATFHYGGRTLTKTYSAKSYIDTVLGMAGFSDEVKALMSAMKDYGHYMQVFLSQSRGWTIGVDHEEMPCASVYTDSDISEATSEVAKYKAAYDVSGSGIKKLTYSLVLDSETALNIYLTPSEAYTGNVSAYLDGGRENLAVKQTDGRYRVQISGISAHLLGNTYTLTVNAGSSFTVKISALSYVNAVLSSNSFGDDAKKGVTSLYRYYKATMSYRESEGIY